MKLKQLSLVVIVAHVLLAPSAFAQSTTTIVTHVDKPELYTLHPPRQMNLDLVVVLKSATPGPEVEALKEWLTQQGFRITYDGAEHGFIDFSGSVDVAESAFQVQIMMTSNGEGYGPLGDAKIPTEFANVVQSIAGLSTISLAPYRLPTPARPTPSASSKQGLSTGPRFKSGGVTAFGPYDLRTFYDATTLIGSGTDGSGADCIAVTEDSLFSRFVRCDANTDGNRTARSRYCNSCGREGADRRRE